MKKKKKNNKKNKEGLGPSEVGPLGHLTWPLNPPKKKQKKQKPPKNKQRKKKKTTNKKQKPKNKEGLGPSEVALWATSPDP